MRAILIDSNTQDIREIILPDPLETNTDALRQALGIDTPFCIGWTFPNGDTLFVDDEGLFKDPQWFMLPAYCPQPLAGRGVLIGPADEEGNATPVQMPIGILRENIRFCHVSELSKTPEEMASDFSITTWD